MNKTLLKSTWWLAVLVSLYLTTLYHYLLFHVLVEFFSIAVATSIFFITWNAKKYIKSPYLQFIGIAYLFIGFLDLLHTLSYKGMGIFTDYDYYANQLWIGTRFLEAVTLLAAFYFLSEKKQLNPYAVFTVFLGISGLLTASVFFWKNFPVCFIEGQGLTPFKVYAEYVISMILAVNLWLLFRYKSQFAPNVFNMLSISLIFTILSELAFTFYISNYGVSNLTGHYFKLISFYLIYKAIIVTGIQEPFAVTFKELADSNEKLKNEIIQRQKAEKEKEETINQLQEALTEVKTLSGLLPVCSGCKKIRDDSGYWNQIEVYIQDHSEAQFSHGICPDCAKEIYGDFYDEIMNTSPQSGKKDK